jgi:NAD(P)-dependent dehydrogenase (short-subunit alcohol dehydrogenase family)
MVDAGKFGYEGQRVLVTGGGSGMGEATARILGDLGAEVHILDVRKPTVANHAFHETDLADPEAIDEAVAAVTEGGKLDALFNCAGLSQIHPPQKVMLVNYIGHRYLTEALLDHMPEGGAIASISSGAGIGWQANMANCMELIGQPDWAAGKAWCEAHPVEVREGYSFSKETIIVWVLMNAMKLGAERKIRINCIAPGPTDTNMMPEIVSDVGQDFMDSYPKPLGRNSTAEEQAWPIVFLNSPSASAVSGNVIYSDQGFAGGLFTGQVDISAMMESAMKSKGM